MICPKCMSNSELKIIETPDMIHYAKLACEIHGFICWLSNDEKLGQRRAQWEDNSDFCGFCGRNKNRLGKNEKIEIDHIKQLSDGGKDIISNIFPLCTPCHKLKNWAQTYFNDHRNGEQYDRNS